RLHVRIREPLAILEHAQGIAGEASLAREHVEDAIRVRLHAASCRRFCASRCSNFACTPPKPPFDMTRTWSPGFSVAASDSTIASISWNTKARAPSGARAPAGSQLSPFA